VWWWSSSAGYCAVTSKVKSAPPAASGGGVLKNCARGTIAHEAIHNMTGWHDANMQVLFGVPVDSRNTRNLSDKLKKKGCGK